MNRDVLVLEEIGADDGARVGGKALRLAAMLRAGLPVPGGFCVTADALARCAADGALPGDLEAEIAAAYAALGASVPVAVRSSATMEDGATASFAGQFDTYLNVVGAEEVAAKVRACAASLRNDRANDYRERAGVDGGGDGRMCVLVQRLVPAESAGVLFTLNPQTGRESEMILEATWGLGEALVSGRVTPDRIVVDAHARAIVSFEVADKRLMTAATAGGTDEAEVPEARRAQPALEEARIWELVDLGLRVQELFGAPQDIEWACHDGRIHLLQARPLTAIAFRDETTQWTSANFREVWPRFMSPLSFSLSAGRFSAEMQAFFVGMGMMPRERVVDWCRSFFGQGYWDVGALKSVMETLPGFVERAFDETVGLPISYEGRGRVTGLTPLTILRGLPILLRLQRSYETVWREAEAYGVEFHAEEAALDAVAPSALTDGEIFAWVRRAVAFRDRTDGFALRNGFMSAQAQDELRPMVDALNEARSDAPAVSMGNLLTGLRRVGTAVPIFEIWALAAEALSEPDVAKLVSEAPPGELLPRLAATPAAAGFWSKLKAFLHRSRHLTQYNDELELPRWDEDPSFALATLREFVAGGEVRDPRAVEETQVAARNAEEARALGHLSRGVLARWLPYRWVKRLPKLLRWLDPRARFADHLARVRLYAWWREETRHRLDRAIYQCRRFVLELGRRLAARGTLADESSVFHLAWGDLVALDEGRLSPDDARRRVARCVQQRAAYRSFAPPATIGGAPAVTRRDVAAVVGRIQGVACSAGATEGRVRIIRTLDEASQFRRGDVLVTQYTNPGWTPLFSLASAIVMEEGGILSHGAVVARECGIPAVLQVRDATRVLRDGQMLRVDGTHGFVDVLDAAE